LLYHVAIRYPVTHSTQAIELARLLNANSASLPVPLSSRYSNDVITEALPLTEWETRLNLLRARPTEFGGNLATHFAPTALDAAIVRRGMCYYSLIIVTVPPVRGLYHLFYGIFGLLLKII
jgi:hypothetical protein